MSFLKVYTNFVKENGLKPNASYVLSLIVDRYNSSTRRTEFYSNEEQDYYAIYTYEQLSQDTNLSICTVRNLLAKLVKLGFVRTVLKHNRVNLLFITAKTKKIADISSQPAVKNNKPVAKKYQLNRLNNKQNNNNNNYINKLQTMGLSDKIIQILQDFTHNSIQKMYLIVGIIMKAKNHAKFEDITTIKKLEDNLYSILSKSSENEKFEGTLFNNIHKLFEKHHHYVKKEHHRVETVPFYLQADYKPKELDPNEVAKLKAKTQALLDKLNHKSLTCID